MLQALTVTLAALAGVLVALFLNATDDDVRCEADEDCPSGQICAEYSCARLPAGPDVRAPRCRLGDPCDKDNPEEHCSNLTCIDGAYHMLEGPELCTEPEVVRFLEELQAKCSKTCSRDQLKDLVLASEDFDQLLGHFGSSFVVLFDRGRPRKRDEISSRWARRRQAYVEQMAPRIGQLAGAQIYLIATASASGRGSGNSDLAIRRFDEVRGLLRDAATAAGIDPNALNIQVTSISDTSQRDAASYQKLAYGRTITWDPEVGERLRELLADPEKATAGMSKREERRLLKWRDETINQSVLVVVNPCALISVRDDGEGETAPTTRDDGPAEPQSPSKDA